MTSKRWVHVFFIISHCMSNMKIFPNNTFQFYLPAFTLFPSTLTDLLVSSLRRYFCLLWFFLLFLGCHTVSLTFHLLSLWRTTWPGQIHSSFSAQWSGCPLLRSLIGASTLDLLLRQESGKKLIKLQLSFYYYVGDGGGSIQSLTKGSSQWPAACS